MDRDDDYATPDTTRLLAELDARVRAAWSTYRDELSTLEGRAYDDAEAAAWDQLQATCASSRSRCRARAAQRRLTETDLSSAPKPARIGFYVGDNAGRDAQDAMDRPRGRRRAGDRGERLRRRRLRQRRPRPVPITLSASIMSTNVAVSPSRWAPGRSSSS